MKTKAIYDRNRPWDYPENFGMCSQLDRKSKTCFFYFLQCIYFLIERNKILISQLLPPKSRYFAGDPMKINFDNFQMKKWVSETVRAQKADEKNGVICLVFMSTFWVMLLKLSKIVSFLHFFVDFSNKSKTVIAVYVYAFESSRSLF